MQFLIALFSTRIGCALAAAVLAGGVMFYKGWDMRADICNAEKARVEAAHIKRDKDQSRVADEESKKLEAELATERLNNLKVIDDLSERLKSRPNPSCALTADDLR